MPEESPEGLGADPVVDPEDVKLVTLARATRARNGAAEGAAVRDTTGRTYAASSVPLLSLDLSALQAAVVIAVASGARGLEAAAVVSDEEQVDDESREAVRDLAGRPIPIVVADPEGVPRAILEA